MLGGDIALGTQYRGMSSEQLEYLEQNAESVTEFIEMRTLMRHSEVDKSTMVEVKAVQSSYPLYGEVKTRGGGPLQEYINRRVENWGALVDPALIEANHVEVGDKVFLGDAELEITGVIEQEPDRLGGSGEFGFWPRILVHRDSLADSGLVVGGSRNFYEYRLRLADTTELAERIQKIRDAFPEAVWDRTRQ